MNTHRVTGGCHCGNIVLRIELTKAPGDYHPRACDCSFCRKHGASYLSDAQGSLIIQIKDEREIGMYRQGSGVAELLVCRICGVLTGACYRSGGQLYAAVNAKAVDDGTTFGAEQPVSPQQLSAGDKQRRWKDLWFSGVKLVNMEPATGDPQ
jgi:hypothetical protein